MLKSCGRRLHALLSINGSRLFTSTPTILGGMILRLHADVLLHVTRDTLLSQPSLHVKFRWFVPPTLALEHVEETAAAACCPRVLL